MPKLRNREKLDKIEIAYEKGQRKVKCFCEETFNRSIVRHLRRDHTSEWESWCLDFVRLRNEGLSYYRIIHELKTKDGKLLFTSKVVRNEILRLVEEKKAKLKIPRKKSIARWHPENFTIQRETLWTFKNRGGWAVHQGDYHGNWSPRIPRALIELYSKEGDTVLDPFVGGGTTLIETWLTNRRGIGLDISPLAVATSKARIQEMAERALRDERVTLKEELRPVAIKGDARRLGDHLQSLGISGNSVKLVCAHPPYLDALRYTATIEGDLSHISEPTVFCDQLQLIAKQIFTLLAENGTCAVLTGDVRKKKRIIPLGFLILERFLEEGFLLTDIIIKGQYNDSSTRFWYVKRDKIDFLLSHEYLLIFRKTPSSNKPSDRLIE